MVVLAMAMMTAQVIAAAEAIDQSADSASGAAPSNALVLPGWPLLLAACASLAALALAHRRRWHVIKRPPLRPPASWVVAGFVLLAGMVLLQSLGAAAAAWLAGIETAAQRSSLDLATQSKIMLGAYSGGLIAVAAFIFVQQALWPEAIAAGRRVGPGRTMRIAVVMLLIIYPLVAAAAQLAALLTWRLTGQEPEPLAHDMLKTLAESPVDSWFVLTVAMIVVAAPICEEVMYRGLVQNMIKRLGLSRWWSITAASVVFAAAHISAAPLHALLALFILSLGMGWAYEKTGRLLAPILMHAMFNAGNIAMLWLMREGTA